MRAVDTNVVVRLLARDDAAQAAAADAFVEGGAWVSTLVLAEVVWVLDAVYGLGPERCATAVEVLLGHRDLSLQDADVVDRALRRFRDRPTVGFSDCLVVELAARAGHGPVGTFDRELGRVEGAQLIRARR